MARRAFYSFHYQADNWRASQVRNMGVIEGNVPCSDNAWEDVKKGGDAAIRRWIDGQLDGRSVAIVLIGSATRDRKWINYEIEQAWKAGKGLLGVHIHRLKDRTGAQSLIGPNPFSVFSMQSGGTLADHVRTYDPPHSDSQATYAYIQQNLANWIERAIADRT